MLSSLRLLVLAIAMLPLGVLVESCPPPSRISSSERPSGPVHFVIDVPVKGTSIDPKSGVIVWSNAAEAESPEEEEHAPP